MGAELDSLRNVEVYFYVELIKTIANIMEFDEDDVSGGDLKRLAGLYLQYHNTSIQVEGNNSIVPDQFKLFGKTINVSLKENLANKYHFEKLLWGEANYSENTIHLQCNTSMIPRKQEVIEAVFFHELTHFLFELLSLDELNNDEKTVDTFAHLLHQFETSKTF